MPRKIPSPSSTDPGPDTDYWGRRLASREFRQALTAALEGELHHLAMLKLADIVDPNLVRQIIDEWDFAALDREQLTISILAVIDAVGEEVRKSNLSAEELLGTQASKDIEILLFDRAKLSDDAEDFLSDLMQQEFTQLLFTEIIFTSIVSFNKKLNPLFGGFAMRAMEDQIRAFIRLFMPMVQTQAATFAVDNQAALRDLMRQILQDGLKRPLGELAREPSQQRRKAGEDLLRRGISSHELNELIRTCAGVGWKAVFSALRDHSVGEIVGLDKHAKLWAKHAAEILLPLLAHGPVVDLVAREAAMARDAMNTPPRAKPKKRETRSSD